MPLLIVFAILSPFSLLFTVSCLISLFASSLYSFIAHSLPHPQSNTHTQKHTHLHPFLFNVSPLWVQCFAISLISANKAATVYYDPLFFPHPLSLSFPIHPEAAKRDLKRRGHLSCAHTPTCFTFTTLFFSSLSKVFVLFMLQSRPSTLLNFLSCPHAKETLPSLLSQCGTHYESLGMQHFALSFSFFPLPPTPAFSSTPLLNPLICVTVIQAT